MMNEFDVIDFVYEAISAGTPNIMIYKDRSETGVSVEHIVINNVTHLERDFIQKTPININIFVPNNSNGMTRRRRIKELRNLVRESLKRINSNDGLCRDIELGWITPMSDLKEGFDCVNIRIDILTDKTF